jgi:hypothetical protein
MRACIVCAGLAEVIEDYGLVNYSLLAIEDKDSVQRLVALIDKATGYVFTGLRDFTPYPPEFVYGARVTDSAGAAADMWEQYQAVAAGPGHDGGAIREREAAAEE